jgi:phage gpG-like protein
VSVDFEQNVLEIRQAFSKMPQAASATATAMAKYIAWRTAEKTLRQSSHPPGAWHQTKAGRPPARASGNLARGMYYKPAYGGIRGAALVGNKVDYSRILEFGCVVVPVHKRFMHWKDSGGSWYHTILVVPPHPFLGPTTDEAIRDGELQRVAVEEFRKYDP